MREVGNLRDEPPLAGRAAELALVRRSCAEAGRSGGVLLLHGDAGIGKSRLLAEALGIAQSSGFLTVLGNSLDGVSAPYAPIVSALRRVLRRLPEPRREELFTGPARLAVGLLPRLPRA